jgi:hypothetical protein
MQAKVARRSFSGGGPPESLLCFAWQADRLTAHSYIIVAIDRVHDIVVPRQSRVMAVCDCYTSGHSPRDPAPGDVPAAHAED